MILSLLVRAKMKVSELIEKLERCDPYADVLVLSQFSMKDLASVEYMVGASKIGRGIQLSNSDDRKSVVILE